MARITSDKEYILLLPKCPHYSKSLKACPGAKKILMADDYERLTKSCTTDQYKSCTLYKTSAEKAA